MKLQVKIKNKTLLLDEWERAGKGSHNKVRRLISDTDKFSCICLMCSWCKQARIIINGNSEKYNSLPFTWVPLFLGPDLFYLKETYYRLYSNPPIFNNFEIKQAQEHLDRFISQFNSLNCFL
jgi:hypothetical protein